MTSPYSDDPIVGEVDVFLSLPPSNSNLHLLQYPLRDARVPIGTDRTISGVKVRPKHGRFEVQVAVHPTPAPGMAPFSESSFDEEQHLVAEKNVGHVQTLRSRASSSKAASNYCMGAFTPANTSTGSAPFLTLVPVKSVTQMRPAFDYLDQYDLQIMRQKMVEKAAKASARGLNVRQQQAQDDPDDGTTQVGFRRRETQRTVERRKNSHATLRQKEEEEAWVTVDFVPQQSCMDAKRNLFEVGSRSILKQDGVFDATTKYTDLYYAHTQQARMGLVAKASVATGEEQLSAKALRVLPTKSAVDQIITSARVVGFREVLRLVGEDKAVSDVQRELKKVAMCIRGCWVAKRGNKELEKMKRADDRYQFSRILVLNLFRTSPVVTEKEAVDALGNRMLITQKSLLSILAEVAEFERGRGWRFRWEDDNHFIAQYESLHSDQQREWDSRVNAARDALSKAR